MMKLNASSYEGQEIMNKATNNEGENLWDVYKTCTWYGKIDGERILRYETKDNTYIVYLDK